MAGGPVPADPSRPGPSRPRLSRPGPSRRSVLAAAAMTFPLLAAGCRSVGALGAPPKPLPDVAVLENAITAEKLMITRYHAVISGSPGQAAFLAPLLTQHQEHLARLASRLVNPPAASGARSPAAAVPAAAVPTAAVPAPTITALQAAEEDAANSLVRHLAEVTPSLAQLLASVAASEASHALLLQSRGATG
jgi:hypothetical protein